MTIIEILRASPVNGTAPVSQEPITERAAIDTS